MSDLNTSYEHATSKICSILKNMLKVPKDVGTRNQAAACFKINITGMSK